MNGTDDIWVSLFFIGIGTFLYARARLRKTKRVFIPDYQRGILYRGGTFARVIGPGSYNSYISNEQIVIVDMRPQPFVIERLLYQDALKSPSVISIGAELTVSDPYRACTALKDQVNDSVAIVRDAMRATLSKSISDTTDEARRKAGEEIAACANADLDKVGMRVANLEVTETWSRPIRSQIASGAN
jgi:hypothetical protein